MNIPQTQPYSYQMELSELFESLSFLFSSSSVPLLDLGLGGLWGATEPPVSPAALGFLEGTGGGPGGPGVGLGRDSSCVLRHDISLGSSPSFFHLLPPIGSSAELRYTRDIDLGRNMKLPETQDKNDPYLGCFSALIFLLFCGVFVLYCTVLFVL